jgi:hypothetical protein
MFVAMSDRRVKTLIVLSFHEGGRDVVAKYLGPDASKMRGYDGFKLEVIDSPDKTYNLASAHMLGSILTRYMTTNFP